MSTSPPTTEDRVFAAFLRESPAGRTPNPDVLCNAEIKFKAFLDCDAPGRAEDHTGHYARVRERGSAFQIAQGARSLKDQVFLHHLNQAQLGPGTMFPVGGNCPIPRCAASPRKSPAEREEAKDWTGICFIGARASSMVLNRPRQPARNDGDDREAARSASTSACPSHARQRSIGIGGSLRRRRCQGRQPYRAPVQAHGDEYAGRGAATRTPGLSAARRRCELGGRHAARGRRLRREDAPPPEPTRPQPSRPTRHATSRRVLDEPHGPSRRGAGAV